MRLLQEAVDGLLSLVALIGPKQLAILIKGLAAKRASGLAPDQALRFLFDIDAALYALEGRAAQALDRGVHAKHRLTRYHDFFASRLQAGERVLEIGSGNGELAYDLVKRCGCKLTGLEIDSSKVAKAAARYVHPGLVFQSGDALVGFPQGPFDAVILSNVLEHIEPRLQLLERLKSFGIRRFLLRVPQFERDWRVPLKRELGCEWRLDPTHETEYTLEDFQAELQTSGLVLVHLECRWGEFWAEAVADLSERNDRSRE